MIKIADWKIDGWENAIRGMRNPMNSWKSSDSRFKEYVEHRQDPNEYDIMHYYTIDYREGRVELDLDEVEKWIDCLNISIGPKDLELMKKLSAAGTDHGKFMRMITVWFDITAPLYWWKEFDTYKVGTVANSCSTMHKIAEKKFEMEDFSHEHLITMPDICSEVPIDNIIVTEIDDNLNTHTGVREELPVTLIGNDSFTMPFSPYGIMYEVIDMLNRCRELYLKTKDKKYWYQLIQLLPSSYNQKRTVMLNYQVLKNMYHARKNHKLDEWHEFCRWIESLPYSELITD